MRQEFYYKKTMDTATCKKLIKLVEKKPILWNRDLEEFNNIELTKRLWEEVGTALNMTTHIVKERWRNLRMQFRREYFRKTSRKKKPWIYFNNMLFVADQMIKYDEKRFRAQRNLENDGNSSPIPMVEPPSQQSSKLEEVFIESESLSIAHLPPLPGSDSSINSNSQPKRPKPNRFILKRHVDKTQPQLAPAKKKKTLESLMQLETDKLKYIKESCAQSQDEDYHFAMSLIAHLRELPRHRKMFVRMRIEQIFCDEYATKEDQTEDAAQTASEIDEL